MFRNLLSGDVLNLKGPKKSFELLGTRITTQGLQGSLLSLQSERPWLVTCMPGKKFPKVSLFLEVLMPQSFQTSKQDGFPLLKSVMLIVELKLAATAILN